MKSIKRALALILAAAMILAMSLTSFAEGTGTITITPPSGTPGTAENTYKIYKVFEADGNGTNISYKLVSGKTTVPAGFEKDDAGNVLYTANKGKKEEDEGFVKELTADDIAAIKAYVTEDDVVATATSVGTAAAVSEALPNGFYFIMTSTGTVVTIDSTNPDVEVIDKNTVPSIEKKVATAANAEKKDEVLAQIGKDVTYTVTITVGKGAKKYVFHDVMGEGLEYNDDVEITGVSKNEYTVKETPDAGDTITVEFADDIEEGTEIIITYSAKVTMEAYSEDPLNNTATIQYGDNKATFSDATRVYNAKINVAKVDGNGTETTDDDEPLEGVGFKLMNSDGDFYKYTEAEGVTWVSKEKADEKVTAETEDEEGNIIAGFTTPFIGLADGTYTLVETKVLPGYNRAEDIKVIIDGEDFEDTNLKQVVSIANNKGTVLPATGGTGTKMFYIIGSILVIGAGIILVAKRRMNLK